MTNNDVRPIPLSVRRLRRIRWAVRVTLVIGVAASVAANVLHANGNPISEAIAAWPPLALLLTIELVSRVPVHRRGLAALRVLATIVISGIAAWVSYWHMVGVAARYGETDASPYLLPVSVDGLIVVASISLVELSARLRMHEDAAVRDQLGTVPDRPPIVLDDQVVNDELVNQARAVATQHRDEHGRDITRDQLRAALRVSNATAGELLHRTRTTPTPAIGELTR